MCKIECIIIMAIHYLVCILNTSTELMSAVELMSGVKSRKWVHQKPTNQPGEVLVFYLPIRFFYYLANLIIFTRSSRIPCIFFLEGGFKGIYLREKNFTLSYVVSEI